MPSVHTTVDVDPTIIPWSMRGSYLSLATRSGQNGRLTPGNDIYLVSHNHPAGLPLFALRPCLHGPLPDVNGFHRTPSPVDFKASPSRMRWVSKDVTVAEATFSNTRNLRLRGSVPMSFDTEGALKVDQWRCWLYRLPPSGKNLYSAVDFTSTPNTALRFVAIKGEFELIHDAPYDFNFKDNNRRLTISPTSTDREWELMVIEHPTQSEEVLEVDQQAAQTFEGAAKQMSDSFEEYVNGMCDWGLKKRSLVTSADRLAAYVMWTSTVRPAGFIGAEAVLMSKLWMNKLWSWDNCINGLALVPYSLDLALDQILLPFQHITPEGRLPDSMTRSELLFDYTKPPVYGWTFFKLLELLNPESSYDRPIFSHLPPGRGLEIYEKISAFTRYWYEHRQTSLSSLPYYTHGNDSGWDNSTAYDYQTVCVSPDLAAFLVVQCDFLAKLAVNLGNDPHEWEILKNNTIDGLVKELWNEEKGAFMFKDALNGSTWSTTTLLQFLPLIASAYLPRTIIDRMAQSLPPYLSDWGLATERLDSKLYESDGYWRGPIWAPPTLMIEAGLRSAGFEELANTVSHRFIRLCEKHGFAENYDAVTGHGNRDLSYTWAASAYLVIRHEQVLRDSRKV